MAGSIVELIEKQRVAKKMYSEGITMAAIASKLGVTRPAVSYWLKQPPTQILARHAEREQQHKNILEGYKRGYTMREIGVALNITGERVRQILKSYGYTGVPRVSNKEQVRAEIQKRKAARVAETWGFTLAEYEKFCAKYGNSENANSPLRKYIQQRRNAGRRNIEWCISFADWWAIWRMSGKWNARGRGAGYCMARHNDTGPYKVGNVSIIPTRENSSQARKAKK